MQSATSHGPSRTCPALDGARRIRGRALLEEFLRRQLPDKRANPGTDLFSVLCQVTTEDGERFSDDDIVNHMIFLLMAAHDTTTITVSGMMQRLGQHPEWQQRCRDEVMALPEHPSLADLDGLTSLDLVMKECLRLVPPVPVLARKTVKETEVMGYRIPAGRLVAVMMHLSHHMDEFWPDPETFDPERFAEHRREDKVAPQRLGAVRRRRAQVPRHVLRRRGGQDRDAPLAATLRVDRRSRLRGADELPLAAVPQGRSAGTTHTARGGRTLIP